MWDEYFYNGVWYDTKEEALKASNGEPVEWFEFFGYDHENADYAFRGMVC